MKIFQLAIAVYLAFFCVTLTMATPCEQDCDEEQLIYQADLTSGQLTPQTSNGIKVTLQKFTEQIGSCNDQGLLKVTFPSVSDGVQKRRLKLVMEMDSSQVAGDFSFHIGDAKDNKGYGRSELTTHSAEVFNKGYDWRVNVNREPGHEEVNAKGYPYIIEDIIDGTVEVIIGDEYLKLDNEVEYCSKEREFLFALSGQRPKRGKVDYDLYIGLNRPISGAARPDVHYGLCSVEIYDLGCE